MSNTKTIHFFLVASFFPAFVCVVLIYYLHVTPTHYLSSMTFTFMQTNKFFFSLSFHRFIVRLTMPPIAIVEKRSSKYFPRDILHKTFSTFSSAPLFTHTDVESHTTKRCKWIKFIFHKNLRWREKLPTSLSLLPSRPNVALVFAQQFMANYYVMKISVIWTTNNSSHSGRRNKSTLTERIASLKLWRWCNILNEIRGKLFYQYCYCDFCVYFVTDLESRTINKYRTIRNKIRLNDMKKANEMK